MNACICVEHNDRLHPGNTKMTYESKKRCPLDIGSCGQPIII
jgi:hypothetical protein